MPEFSLTAGQDIPLLETLADMPKSARPFISAGLKRLSNLDPAMQRQVSSYVISRKSGPSEVDIEDFAEEMKIGSDEAAEIGSSLSLLLAIVSSRKDNADEIANAFLSAGLILAPNKESLTRFLDSLLPGRAEITRAVRLERLAEETLPSFVGLQTSIDLRIGFRKQKVDATVPVLLAHLHTDSSQNQVFFQMQKTDVQRLIRQLEKAAARLDEVEKWTSSRNEQGS